MDYWLKKDHISHHGVKGQRWGVRRYQNADGSYTAAGKKRYGVGDGKSYKDITTDEVDSYLKNSDYRKRRKAAYKKENFDGGKAYWSDGAGHVKRRKLTNPNSKTYKALQKVQDAETEIDAIQKKTKEQTGDLDKKHTALLDKCGAANDKAREYEDVMYDAQKAGDTAAYKRAEKEYNKYSKQGHDYWNQSIDVVHQIEAVEDQNGMQEAIKKYSKARDNYYDTLASENQRFNREWAGVALKEMGYEDTDAGRKYIEEYLTWNS